MSDSHYAPRPGLAGAAVAVSSSEMLGITHFVFITDGDLYGVPTTSPELFVVGSGRHLGADGAKDSSLGTEVDPGPAIGSHLRVSSFFPAISLPQFFQI